MPIFPTYEIAKWNSQITWLTHHLPVTSRMELNLRRSARWSHGDGFCLVHFLFSTSFRNKSIQSRSNFIFYSLDRYLFFILTIFPAIIRKYRSFHLYTNQNFDNWKWCCQFNTTYIPLQFLSKLKRKIPFFNWFMNQTLNKYVI